MCEGLVSAGAGRGAPSVPVGVGVRVEVDRAGKECRKRQAPDPRVDPAG